MQKLFKTRILGVVACVGLQVFFNQTAFADSAIPSSGLAIGDMTAFDEAMNRILTENDIPGGSLAVAYNGKLLLVKSYGYASKSLLGGSKPATTDMVWRLASVSKPITSIAVMQLVDQGKVLLDEPVLSYLKTPDRPLKLTDERIAKITIRMLMQHRSGLLSTTNDPMTGPSPPCPNATGQWLESHTLVDDPGTKYAYSNTGYCLLGLVIKHVSGLRYDDYVKQMMSKLGVRSIRVGSSKASGPNEVEYYQALGEPKGPYQSFNLEGLGAAGGLVGTPRDLVTFIDHIFGTADALIKNKEVFMEILKPPTENPDRRFYGLGFNVVPFKQGTQTLFHYGSLPGTSSFIAKYANGWTIAAIFNKRRQDYNALGSSIDNALSSARALAKLPSATEYLPP
jgi:N-acyl-D-amino-acid deacylase